MPPKYTPPEPADMALLRNCHHLSHPGQKAILDDFAAGAIGVETTAYLLIEEAKERFPAFKAAREAEAEARDARARELREMAVNETAAEPQFIEYTPEGRPVKEVPKPLPAGALTGLKAVAAAVATVPTSLAAETTAETTEPAAAVETAEAPAAVESSPPNNESTESADDAQPMGDGDWVGEEREDEEREEEEREDEEHNYESDQ